MPSELDSLRGQIESLEIERKAINPGGKSKAIIAGIDLKLRKARDEFDQMNSIWRQHRAHLDRLTSVESKRQELTKLFEQSKANGDYDFAAKVQYSELPKFEAELKQIQKELEGLQKQHHFLRQIVGRREVAEVISVWSGVPVSKMLESDAARLMSMEARISARVFGQEQAVRSVSRAVRRARAGVNEPGRPQGVFMFIGPTGVGKTETARALAAELFDDDSKIVRIDMSEYMQEPYSVILFDEIEKAHPRVLDVLLQTFDAGRMTDGHGRVVDFSNTLIVLTSNLKPEVEKFTGAEGQETALRHALAEILRPEFVNRLDEVVEFRSLGVDHYSRLVDKQLAGLNARLEDRAVRIYVGRKLRDRLVEVARDGRFGGRALKRAFESLVVDAVSEKIIQEPDKFTGAWSLDCDDFGRISWHPGSGETPLLPAAKGL
jgi:ATP-dependent Clp protease ATP-binding subunit ClpB